jgi:GntR family transcriptional regulator/MocR family aminotransferase
VERATETSIDRTSSRELLVDLADVPRGRLGTALENALRAAIRDGRLRAGSRLPSTRALAADLSVSRGVVVKTYEQLAAEGYLTTAPGSAARVPALQVAGDGRARPATAPADRWEVDFRPGTPSLGSLPRADWERAVRRGFASLTDAELGYGDPRGLPRLREALADYLGRVRGAVVDPAHVVVVNGFAQGLAVAARLLGELGFDRVGVEDPGSVQTSEMLADNGIDLAPVAVDGCGLDVSAVGDLRAVLITPAHQFPTGVVLAPERRRQLVEWADRVDGLVIEDDYDAEYRYDHHPVGVVQGIAPHRVLLGGTTSKTLAPGIRIGWLAAPPALAEAAARHKRQIDLMSPVLEQAAFAEFLSSGQYERHVRRTRTRYRRRRDLLMSLLADALPDAAVEGGAAGLHLLLSTPGVTDEAAVVRHAAGHGVRVAGVGSYQRSSGRWPAGFVLGYGHLTDGALRRGVTVLGDAVRAARAG